jgi:hypothetical protein
MTAIARLKITLDDVKPQVLRRVDVPLTIKLDRLHLVLQAAMGWTNSHLWVIHAGDVSWGPQADDDFANDTLDARKTRLIEVLEDVGTKTLHYLYDFGDGWHHTIKIERILNAIPGLDYPLLVAATGRCPLEDVGGPSGYAAFLKDTAEPNLDPNAQNTTHHDPAVDPNIVDFETIILDLEALATRWRPKPRVKRSRPI